MLQKTSLRIKHFISQQRNQNTPNLGYDFDGAGAAFSDLKCSISSPRRLSWLSTPSEAITLRRSNSNATEQSHHIHQQSTAHSSASSLCSCDCNEYPVPTERSLSRVESPTVQPEILYLPPELPTNASEDAKSWRLIFPECSATPQTLRPPSKLRIATPSLTTPTISPTPLAELPALNFSDDDRTPTQSVKRISYFEMEDPSSNVEQLIRETDEAFKAVGSALADAKAATQGWYDTENTPVTRTLSIPLSIMRNSRSPVPAPPIVRSAIAKKGAHNAKGKAGGRPVVGGKKKKPLIFGRESGSSTPPPPARWTLNDVTANMVDVFSGKRFRMEVDEMLTPTRIQKLKDEQAAAEDVTRSSQESRRSIAIVDTDGDVDVETPTEPFHLERLSEKIDAVKREKVHTPPVFTSPRAPPPIAQVKRSVATTKKPTGLSKKVDSVSPISPGSRAGMVFNDFSFPAPPFPLQPRIPSRRASASAKGTPMLPTIPEISPLNLSPTPFFNQNQVMPTLILTPPPTHFFLPSTSFSLLSPFFKHGPIRIERIPKPRKESSKSSREEGLDWVAFQMAISGNMDEYGRDIRSNSEWEIDEVEIDELEAWWIYLGLHIGEFSTSIDHEDTKEMIEIFKPKPLNITPPRLSPYKEAEEQLLKFWKSEIDTNKIVENPEVDLDAHATIHGQTNPEEKGEEKIIAPPIEEVRRPSAGSTESMPPSPMLDLGRVSPLKDGDIIPMGFNLAHDLGDFLIWETNHVQMLMTSRDRSVEGRAL